MTWLCFLKSPERETRTRRASSILQSKTIFVVGLLFEKVRFYCYKSCINDEITFQLWRQVRNDCRNYLSETDKIYQSLGSLDQGAFKNIGCNILPLGLFFLVITEHTKRVSRAIVSPIFLGLRYCISSPCSAPFSNLPTCRLQSIYARCLILSTKQIEEFTRFFGFTRYAGVGSRKFWCFIHP